mgnify:CR=1 FL=1
MADPVWILDTSSIIEIRRSVPNADRPACSPTVTYDKVKAVLSQVADVLDPTKDSGADEADPYVLALAVSLREQSLDARVVTQETKDSPRKMSFNTASGLLGIPSVPLRGLLRAEWTS